MISFAVINDLIDALTASGSVILTKLRAITDRVNKNETDIRELKDMTPDKIGLGQVRNYAPSTLSQAIAAINNTSNMTPRRTRDYAEANIFGPMGEAFRDAKNRLP